MPTECFMPYESAKFTLLVLPLVIKTMIPKERP